VGIITTHNRSCGNISHLYKKEDKTMKKLLLTTAIVMSFGTTAAFAHHPAADMVDEDTYEMIDANVSDIHRDMIFDDDMGGDVEVGGAAESRDDAGNAGVDMGGDVEDVGAAMGGDMEDVGAAAEDRDENNAMAGIEPSGPGTQR
jgi:hypothetical protein